MSSVTYTIQFEPGICNKRNWSVRTWSSVNRLPASWAEWQSKPTVLLLLLLIVMHITNIHWWRSGRKYYICVGIRIDIIIFKYVYVGRTALVLAWVLVSIGKICPPSGCITFKYFYDCTYNATLNVIYLIITHVHVCVPSRRNKIYLFKLIWMS